MKRLPLLTHPGFEESLRFCANDDQGFRFLERGINGIAEIGLMQSFMAEENLATGTLKEREYLLRERQVLGSKAQKNLCRPRQPWPTQCWLPLLGVVGLNRISATGVY